jgi:hypothetical protein
MIHLAAFITPQEVAAAAKYFSKQPLLPRVRVVESSVGPIPRLAGRSPSYLLRQLLAFKVGARAGRAGAPMKPVADNLQLGDMIDATAYAASLPP